MTPLRRDAACVLAGALGLQLLIWGFTPRSPTDAGTLARMDAARIEAEHRAETAEAERDAAKAQAEATERLLKDSVQAARERERQAAEDASESTRTAQATGATVGAQLVSVGADMGPWREHVAADSAVNRAWRARWLAASERADAEHAQAVLWKRQNTLTEIALAAEQDAHAQANTQLVEATARLNASEKARKSAERWATFWKIGAIASTTVAGVQAVGGR